MGSDLYMNPPPPDPIWHKVQDLYEHDKRLRGENEKLHAELNRLQDRCTKLEKALADGFTT